MRRDNTCCQGEGHLSLVAGEAIVSKDSLAFCADEKIQEGTHGICLRRGSERGGWIDDRLVQGYVNR